jgi:Fe2+ transport system protein FeoA
MRALQTKNLKNAVCGQELDGRILKYDHSGRILRAGLRLLHHRQPQGARQLSVLSELKVGETGVLVALDLPDSVQNHLMHMGFIPGALVTVLRRAPAGDPTVYAVDGMEIALRHETAESIRVRTPEEEAENPPQSPQSREIELPELIEAAR